MIILILFAFLAGIATIFAPCILPILPVVLSAGLSGGKRRPIGIVVGLVVSFTFFTLSLSYLVRHLGLNADILRDVAIIVLLVFGSLLLIPKLLSIAEVWLSSIIPQGQSTSSRNDFFGGVLIGVSLGLVWTPCVGPIVASVITLAATSTVTAASVFITAAYALGTSISLVAIIYGGKNLMSRLKLLRQITPQLQQVFGGIMVLTAVGMLFGLDRTVQAALLAKLPSSISSGFTQQLEQSKLVTGQIQQLKGVKGETIPASTQIIGGVANGLPSLGAAPNFVGIDHWLNSDPLTISQLRGKVVLVDFWTYSCINCIRTLPHVTSWYDTYKDQGFVVIGVHAPEFAFEHETNNVAAAIKQYGIHYPVAQDNELTTWTAYNNQYWPAEYLIDASGTIRDAHFGEGNYDQTEANIRALLKELKQTTSLPSATKIADTTPNENLSPETYLGMNRRTGYLAGATPAALRVDRWTDKGQWRDSPTFITSGQAGDTIAYRFSGKDAYLILTPPPSGSTAVQILVDGQAQTAGTDASNGIIMVNGDRLYHLAHFSDSGTHLLALTFTNPGTKVFTFTFG